jgi:hypothetical protein
MSAFSVRTRVYVYLSRCDPMPMRSGLLRETRGREANDAPVVWSPTDRAVTQKQRVPRPRRPLRVRLLTITQDRRHARRQREILGWLARGRPVRPSHFPQRATGLSVFV